MSARAITVSLLALVVLVLSLWDIYVALSSGTQSGGTVSEVVQRAATQNPIIPFALGLLMGHLFWK